MSPGEFDRAAFVAGLRACGALQHGTFTLASGRTSTYYVDIKKAVTRPDLLRAIGDGMSPYAAGADRIAGVELGAVPIAAVVSLVSGKPYLMVPKEAKGHRVLFVEDVVTTGGTLRSAIERLRHQGAVVTDVVAVVDREEGGKIGLAEIGVRLHALVSSKDLLTAS